MYINYTKIQSSPEAGLRVPSREIIFFSRSSLQLNSQAPIMASTEGKKEGRAGWDFRTNIPSPLRYSPTNMLKRAHYILF